MTLTVIIGMKGIIPMNIQENQFVFKNESGSFGCKY